LGTDGADQRERLDESDRNFKVSLISHRSLRSKLTFNLFRRHSFSEAFIEDLLKTAKVPPAANQVSLSSFSASFLDR
jgi:hypothetical protein